MNTNEKKYMYALQEKMMVFSLTSTHTIILPYTTYTHFLFITINRIYIKCFSQNLSC